MVQQEDVERIWLVVAPELRRSLVAEIPDDLRHRVQMIALNDRERRLCTHRRLAISGFSRWWVMRRYLHRTGAQAGTRSEEGGGGQGWCGTRVSRGGA